MLNSGIQKYSNLLNRQTRACENFLNVDKCFFFFLKQQSQEYRYERRNPRHPEVGRARPPDLTQVKSKVGSKNSHYRRREPSKVKIFNDKDYMKVVKVCVNLYIIYHAMLIHTKHEDILIHPLLCCCLHIEAHFPWMFFSLK